MVAQLFNALVILADSTAGTRRPHGLHQQPAWRFAHVVHVGLEGQALQSDAIAHEVRLHLLEDHLLWRLHRVQDQLIKAQTHQPF